MFPGLLGEHLHPAALSLLDLKRFEEAKSLLRKAMPVARRVVRRECRDYAQDEVVLRAVLCKDGNDDSVTLDDLREAELLEDTARTARRVLGGAHPITPSIELALRCAQGAPRLRNRSGATTRHHDQYPRSLRNAASPRRHRAE